MEWLNMDGDGIYVWPCYALTLLVMVANVWAARSNHRSLLKRATARSRGTAPNGRESGAEAEGSRT